MKSLKEFQKSDEPFIDFLREVHAEDYKGTDDDMADNFDNWLGDTDIEEYINHANAFSKLLLDLIPNND